ncbi:MULTISPECIES: metallopeptidase family protein [Inquilinus]|uniref:Zn-dependent protease with MMP-like domain n=1 Tax=Inquilinus ginsengisoli TaxID=363840 RepID=A0ABU1K117_9PROT|nr:metallopeptidase family protein [Inquilinus ginsengisoli]MDR6293479.1 putative Zn-dependent protease with MMP-like domain [Inquilinus ginsengisoli]
MSPADDDIPAFGAPPSIEDLIVLAEEGFERVPARLRAMVRGVAIQVVDFPDDDTLDEMEIESPYDLLGLYTGTPFGQKTLAVATRPDMIFLYRRPILDYWCDTGEDLGHVVRHVLIHEIGHHFGFSDADMEALEQEADEGEAEER